MNLLKIVALFLILTAASVRAGEPAATAPKADDSLSGEAGLEPGRSKALVRRSLQDTCTPAS